MPPTPVHYVLTDATTTALITPAGVWVLDKKTGAVLEFIPEMPILREFDAVASAGSVLSATQHLKGAEELRLQAGKFIASFAEKANQTLAARAAKRVA